MTNETLFNDIVQRAEDAAREALDAAPKCWPCGFGWVWIPDGRSSFARWLVKTGRARKHWQKGIQIWARTGVQDITKNEAWAQGYADSLRNEPALAGLPIYAQSRLD